MPDLSRMASAKATLAFGSTPEAPKSPSMTATFAEAAAIEAPVTIDLAEEAEVLGETLWASESVEPLAKFVKSTAAAARTTVLPRRRAKDATAASVIEGSSAPSPTAATTSHLVG
jgi:hypothetical protein